jgi:hypothetical protein
MAVSWEAEPCSLVEIDRRFTSAYYLHHQAPDPNSNKEGILIMILSKILWMGAVKIKSNVRGYIKKIYLLDYKLLHSNFSYLSYIFYLIIIITNYNDEGYTHKKKHSADIKQFLY